MRTQSIIKVFYSTIPMLMMVVLFQNMDNKPIESCSLAGVSVPVGSTYDFYSVESVPYGKSCEARMRTRTCRPTGVFNGSDNFKFASCEMLAQEPFLNDLDFTNGLILLTAGKPSNTVAKELTFPTTYSGPDPEDPSWAIGQWYSRVGSSFANANPRFSSTQMILVDKTQSITLYKNPVGDNPKLKIAMDGIAEFNAPSTSKVGPSMVINRYRGLRMNLEDLSGLNLFIKYRIPYLRAGQGAKNATTASLNLVIRDQDETSSTKGAAIKFKIMLFDSNNASSPAVTEGKVGGRSLLYAPAQSKFTNVSNFSLNQWISYRLDILPLLRDAVKEAVRLQIFASDQNLNDKTLGDFSISLNIEGAYSTALELQTLDLSPDFNSQNSCRIDGVKINNGVKQTFYDRTTGSSTSPCHEHQEDRICQYTLLSGHSNFKYAKCVDPIVTPNPNVTPPTVTTPATPTTTTGFNSFGSPSVGTVDAARAWGQALGLPTISTTLVYCPQGYYSSTGQCPNPDNKITILEADYGRNVRRYNNATSHMSSICNGQKKCSYYISTSNLGDPFRGYMKDFYVEYTCTDGKRRTASVGIEANGQWINISCD